MRIRSGADGRRVLPRALTAVMLSAMLVLAACSTQDASPDSADSAAVPADTAATSLDLVLLGDSVWLQAWPALELRLEEELGADIVVHDWINPDIEKYEIGGERSGDLLERLRTDEDLRDDLRAAEIIAFDVPTGVVQDVCVGDPSTATVDEARACFDEATTIYRNDAPAIIDELVGLRSPDEAVIRATTVWQFLTPTFRAAGTYDVVRRHWQQMNAAVLDSADQHGITVLPAYDTFSGPDGSRDPVAAGDVDADEIHLTSQGVDRLVELFVASGLPAGGGP